MSRSSIRDRRFPRNGQFVDRTNLTTATSNYNIVKRGYTISIRWRRGMPGSLALDPQCTQVRIEASDEHGISVGCDDVLLENPVEMKQIIMRLPDSVIAF